jgi:cardiolipin synthase
MIESIEAAQNRVLLSTYILKTDHTGSAFFDALTAAVARGVKVMVLIDGVGAMYSWPRPDKILRQRGIDVAKFLPPRLIPPSIYLNLRNHKKILIVDRSVAYAGGMNISDENVSSVEAPLTVSDVHFSLRGPIVDSLAEIFYRDWQFSTGHAHQNELLETNGGTGTAFCRAIPDGPDDEMDALELAFQSVISGASESVEIMTPYFLPGRKLISALRGVKIRIVLPANNNLIYVHWANRNILIELINLGISIYYQPGPFCHTKILCIDQEYCLIGSANLDPRSLRLNFELGIEVFSTELNTSLRAHLEKRISISAPITRAELASRSVPIRLRDSFMALFSPYL